MIDSMKPEIRILKGESGRIRVAFLYSSAFIEKVKIPSSRVEDKRNPKDRRKLSTSHYLPFWRDKRSRFGYSKLDEIGIVSCLEE